MKQRRITMFKKKHTNLKIVKRLTATVSKLKHELHKYQSTQKKDRQFNKQSSIILESITDAFYAIDSQWRFTYINKQAAKYIKMRHQEMLGRNIFEAFPTLIGSDVEKNYHKAMAEQVAVHFETASNVFPGVWFDMHVYPSKNGLSVYFRDISEQKNLQRQLYEAQKLEAIGQLAGGLAHDLNNQLTIIMGYTDLRLNNLTPENQYYKDFCHIKYAVERSANLTRQLLMFSRRQPLQKEPVNLNLRLKDYQVMLEQLVRANNIKLRFDLADNLCMIHADPTNLDQVIMNLTLNARDALTAGGTITFTTQNRFLQTATHGEPHNVPAGHYVVLSVADNGIGIEQGLIPHIFEPFFTTKDRTKGTGLGLAVVYGIIRSHDGWINVHSSTGKGCQFDMFFPAFVEQTSESVKNHHALPLPYETYRGNGQRILLVEDETEVVCILQKILHQYGFIVFPCRTVNEALNTYKTQAERFDLVLSDIILPDGRGTELVNQLLQMDSSLKILLVSGYSDDLINLQNIQKRGFPFLAKPYTVEDLLKQLYLIFNNT